MSLDPEQKKILEDWVSSFTDFENIYPLPSSKSFRINTLRIPEKIFNEISGLSSDTVPWDNLARVLSDVLSLGNTFEYVLGYLHTQSLSSMIPSLILSPKPGEIVLDLTSAPGSKTSQMAALMNNKGVLVANDVPAKEGILTTNLSRLGVLNTLITTENAKYYSKRGVFDKVLVDAPCTAFGSKENSFNRFKPEVSKSISGIQASILKSGIRALKPGGELVYSVCSISPFEGEKVIRELLNGDESIQVLDINDDKISGIPHHTGLTDYGNDVKKAWRVYANEINSESFFICKLKKVIE